MLDFTRAYLEDSGHFFHVLPDEVDALVDELAAAENPDLTLDVYPQYGGRRAYALTFAGLDGERSEKLRLFVARPHAHEPAGVAASCELAKLLGGYREYAAYDREWREWALANFVVTLLLDANPSGSQRAPVKFWSGSQVSREEFRLWMFGESGAKAGQRFQRVAAWDVRKVQPPARIGNAYEQINAYEYVEPNRDYRSTLFRAFFQLDRIHGYQAWVDLHQTEFERERWNAQVHLSSCHDEMPAWIQKRDLSLAEAIHACWRRAGGSPAEYPCVPYRDNITQRQFLTRVWKPITARIIHLVTEVQNNNLATPPALQVHLQASAVFECMSWMNAHRQLCPRTLG